MGGRVQDRGEPAKRGLLLRRDDDCSSLASGAFFDGGETLMTRAEYLMLVSCLSGGRFTDANTLFSPFVFCFVLFCFVSPVELFPDFFLFSFFASAAWARRWQVSFCLV